MANSHIITFIQNLSEAETKIAEDYLQKSKALFSESAESKELQFFKYLVLNRSRPISDEEIVKAIPIKDLSHLKINVYNKVLESLTLDKHIFNASIFNEYDSVIFSLKKKILTFKINLRCINQGKTEGLKELLNDIIKEALEYEVYDVLIEALTAKKYFISIRIGINEFNKINEEIDFYSVCVKALYYANDCYYKIILSNDLIKSLSEKEVDKHIQSSIKQMEIDYKRTKSQQINYYLHILKFALSERQKNYSLAIKQCNQLIELFKKSKITYRKERVGNALLNLCQFKIFAGDYISAAKDAKKAREYYIENSFDDLVTTEQEFHAYFYDKEYEKAEKCVNRLLNHSSDDAGEFRKSKFSYYQACILFATGKYKEALQLLNTSLEIEKDKSRWNVSLRILNIQLFIELNKIDEASNSLESLRKYMERTGKTEEIKPRDILIVKLLREMEKDGFMLELENKAVTKLLKELSEKDGSASWEHYSSELIPFHDWLNKKSK
jgi:hypothetical protein